MNLYYRSLTNIGLRNIPKKGPLILIGTHNNQFIDAMFLMAQFPRKINFIMAKSSNNHTFLKFFFPFLNIIFTERPIDYKKLGVGKILRVNKNKVIGDQNCWFLKEFKEKDNILIGNSKKFHQINKIESDNVLYLNESLDINENIQIYYIIPKLEQGKVYNEAIELLNKGEVIGIFPEGGSHDQTFLINIKPGAYIFALEYFKKYNKMPFWQVAGLNYFGSHKFRSKTSVFFGKTFKLEEKYFYDYNNQDKRKETIKILIDDLKFKMEEVKITAPSMSYILDLQIVKNLYVPKDINISEKESFFILKKLSEGYLKGKNNKDISEYMVKIRKFRKELKSMGVKIKQFKMYNPNFLNVVKLFWISLFKIILLMPIFVPFLIVFYPINKIIVNYSERKRIQALKNSVVKIKGYDVISSWKILFSLFFIPLISTVLLIFLALFLLFVIKKKLSEIYMLLTYLAFIFPVYIYCNLTSYIIFPI